MPHQRVRISKDHNRLGEAICAPAMIEQMTRGMRLLSIRQSISTDPQFCNHFSRFGLPNLERHAI
jgi:hypothetical protein